MTEYDCEGTFESGGQYYQFVAWVDWDQGVEPLIKRALRHNGAASSLGGLVRVRVFPIPPMPPALPGETDDEYTNRLTGADRTGRKPYTERRFRQCSIGYHLECSDPPGNECQCPCHPERMRVLGE